MEKTQHKTWYVYILLKRYKGCTQLCLAVLHTWITLRCFCVLVCLPIEVILSGSISAVLFLRSVIENIGLVEEYFCRTMEWRLNRTLNNLCWSAQPCRLRCCCCYYWPQIKWLLVCICAHMCALWRDYACDLISNENRVSLLSGVHQGKTLTATVPSALDTTWYAAQELCKKNTVTKSAICALGLRLLFTTNGALSLTHCGPFVQPTSQTCHITAVTFTLLHCCLFANANTSINCPPPMIAQLPPKSGCLLSLSCLFLNLYPIFQSWSLTK